MKDSAGHALFHVVRFKEGGFVVTSAEDDIEPVIAFSENEDLVEDERNPLWVMLNRDLPQRQAAVKNLKAQPVLHVQTAAALQTRSAQWQTLLSSDNSTPTLSATTGLSSVSDLRVSPFLTTTWDQSTAYGGACYNYYTPPYTAGSTANYVCGCVATAGAQLMRYHQYPTASVSPGTYTIWVDGVASNATMIGGTYDWSNMPTTPSASSTTLANRQAIGKLTYDVGVACYMSYTSSGSGAYDPNLVGALKNRFGYANAIIMLNQASGVDSSLANAALSNLDAKYPVLFGISGDGGHEVVGDGYGYVGSTLYVHLNMGWSGSYNAWYNLPSFTAYYSFNMLDSIIYNVFSTSSGEVISGRVLDKAGVAVSGATVVATNQSTSAGVSAVTTDANGVYALRVSEPGGSQTPTYTVTANLDGRRATASATVKASKSTSYTYNPATGGMSYTPGSGTVGNSWGNNLTLPDATPNAPTGVSAGDGGSTSDVTVSWTAVTDATGYGVYRYTSDTSASASLLGGTAATSYTDTTATPGTLYYYWVKATNAAGASAFSPSDSGYRALSAPAGVSASESSTSAVVVTWSAVTGASYYRVYRAITPTGTKSALGAWQASLTYSDTTTDVGITNYYWVAAAVDASGTRPSAYSDYDTGMRLAPYTVTTATPVPFAWLDAYGLVTNGDYEASALADVDGDGYAAWQEYVAGTVPTNAASVFTAFITLSNQTPVIFWSPDLGTARVYTVEGKASLTNADWLTPTNADSRFFRVKVSTE